MEVVFGIVISVLSTIVMLLIGWQIYSTIEAKSELKKMDTVKKNIEYELNHVNLLSAMALADFYYQLNTNDAKNIQFKYILYVTTTILQASRIKNFEICKEYIDIIIQVTKLDKLVILKEQKKMLLDLIRQMKYTNEIHRFDEFFQLVVNITVK